MQILTLSQSFLGRRSTVFTLRNTAQCKPTSLATTVQYFFVYKSFISEDIALHAAACELTLDQEWQT